MQDNTSEAVSLQPISSEEVNSGYRKGCQRQQQHSNNYLLEKEIKEEQLQLSPGTALTFGAPERTSDRTIKAALGTKGQKSITRSQSSKIIQELHQHREQNAIHQLKQQQSLPVTLHSPAIGVGSTANVHSHHPNAPKSVSILVYKTLNTVFKSSRKIIVRVCEVANAKKTFTMFKFNKAAAQNRAENRANACTGHDQFVRPPVPEKKVKHIMKKLHKQNGLKRSNSAIEFDVSALTAANRRHIYSRNRSASSEQDNSDQSEHSEKSPLVSARLDNLARIFFSKSMPAETGSRDTIESVLTTRPNLKYQYSALDSGNGVVERSPRERAQRDRALGNVQEWIQTSNGRYEVIAHLDEIGSRHGKNWFLVTDSSVRTDRLLTLLPLPPDCVAFEDLQANENPKGLLMELLGSLHHPYIYPVLDLGFLRMSSNNFACLVTPFNSRGSLKDLIYKAQWNEPWARKYTRKPIGLPVTQVQRLGRQILEALLFLKERGFPLHGHLHSGNVILQNGAARLSGLENGLLGLSSRINAVMWSRSTTDIENVDIICFGHLLYEMCTGQEMNTPKPSMRVLEMELEHYPQIVDVLGLIFEPPSGVCPSVEELVLCDLFRSIDLRELRGPCFSTIKPSLSRSTLNLLHAVKKRQCASLGNSFSEASSPSSPPSTPRDNRRGVSRTMDSFDLSSDSEVDLLDEIVVGTNDHQQRFHQLQRMQQWQRHDYLSYSKSSQASTSGYAHSQYKKQRHDQNQKPQRFDALQSPIHYCESTSSFEDNSCSPHENQAHNYQTPRQPEQPKTSAQQLTLPVRCNSIADIAAENNVNVSSTSLLVENVASSCHPLTMSTSVGSTFVSYHDAVGGRNLTVDPLELEVKDSCRNNGNSTSSNENSQNNIAASTTLSTGPPIAIASGTSSSYQLTADMCNYKNSKSRRLEYSLKCLKYGRSNPSQDSAFGSLTDNDFSAAPSSSFRISSFQSVSSPIDEGVEDVIIATTGGNETCLELTTMPRSMVSQDSAISSPCRETSPSHFLNIEDCASGSCSGGSSSSGSTGNVRPQHFPVSLSPKIFVTATTNSSNSSLSSSSVALQQTQQFDPPTILVNDQNSIYTTSPSKRSGTIEVFSQKYRVSSFEDMSPGKHSASDKNLKNVNRMAFRSLEEERRIDSAFKPIADRTNSDNRVNMQSEKYKKLTHASFCISKTSSQVAFFDASPGQNVHTISKDSTTIHSNNSADIQQPLNAFGSTSSRQTMWRDSKFYRKNRIAISNDSLLDTSPNHSARLSPVSLRDNHFDNSSPYGSCSHSRQSLNCGSSINEIAGLNQTPSVKQGLTVTTSFYNSGADTSARRYCSSKSEDLGESNDYLRVMDARKSYSERHLVTLTKLKQTAINNTTSSNEYCCFSEDEININNDNNIHSNSCCNDQRSQQNSRQHQTNYKVQQHREQQTLEQNDPKERLEPEIQDIQQGQASKRSHPNQLSRSTNSINCLKTTNIKTTSLGTLGCCHQHFTYAATALSTAPSSIDLTTFSTTSASTISTAPDNNDASHFARIARGSAFRSLDQALNTTNYSNSLCGNGTGTGSSNTYTATEDNSSPEDSPSHRTLSGADFSNIFSVDDAQSSGCSEEKTPLLDSVEMSPISPTEPDE